MAFQVKKTKREAPVRAVFYGPGGVGKSTLAANAPSPIFLAAEEGLENIDAAAVEPYPTTWEDVLGALDYVATLDHETLVVDSLDWLEPIIWEYVCRKAKKTDIEAFGYGKGYIAALDQWRVLLRKLGDLRAKGMNILLIAHAARKMFKNPEGEDFEHWTIKLNEKATGLIVEWVDVVGFCRQDVAVDDTGSRNKALSTGRRIISTHPHPAYLAKTRFAMPPRIDLSWKAFAHAAKGGDAATIMHLQSEVERRIRELRDDAVEKKVREYLKEYGETMATLTEAVERLDITIGAKKAS